MSSRGQPTRAGPPACVLDEVLTKDSFLRNVIQHLGLEFIISNGLDQMSD